MPTALLARLYDIEEISATRRPLPSMSLASKKRTAGSGARPDPSAREARRDRTGRAEGLEDEEVENFLTALEMAEHEDCFPSRVAWELQSEFWLQDDVEVRRGDEGPSCWEWPGGNVRPPSWLLGAVAMFFEDVLA